MVNLKKNIFVMKNSESGPKFRPTMNTMAVNMIPDGTPMKGADAFYDEVSFWDRELTKAEITKLYNDGAGLSLLSN